MDYEKYIGEGEVLEPTINLIHGFMNFITLSRNDLFGIHMILGEEPNLEIQGVWLFKGTDINQILRTHPQLEYYKCRRLDLRSEVDRILITEFWRARVDYYIHGMRVNYIKVHK